MMIGYLFCDPIRFWLMMQSGEDEDDDIDDDDSSDDSELHRRDAVLPRLGIDTDSMDEHDQDQVRLPCDDLHRRHCGSGVLSPAA